MKFKTEQEANDQSFRQKILLYKRVFGSRDGREVLLDLMNKNYVLNETGGDVLKEGKRACVLEIMHLSKLNLREFDKLMSDEGGEK